MTAIFLAIGAQLSDGVVLSSGSVHLFLKTNDLWVYQTTIDDSFPGLSLDLNGYFGSSVALSADGSRLAIGAARSEINREDSGSVYLFTNDGTGWVYETVIDETVNEIALGGYTYFGSSVAFSDDGTVLAVGAIRYAGASSGSGGVYLFSYDGSSWNHETIISGDTQGFGGVGASFFGYSVALSADGSFLVVGSVKDRTSDFVFTGAVHMFAEQDGAWGYVESFDNDTPGLALGDNDYFGSGVSVSDNGSLLAVGAFSDDDADVGSNTGIVYLFQKQAGVWGLLSTLTPSILSEK